MSMALEALGRIVLMVNPTTVELSIVEGVGPGWEYPISSRAVHREMVSLQP